jgi:hypothetical protein
MCSSITKAQFSWKIASSFAITLSLEEKLNMILKI